MKCLTLCTPGKYKIKSTKPWSKRLSEMGFIVDRRLYVIVNNSLGIRVRIDNVVYLINQMTAVLIYVEPVEE